MAAGALLLTLAAFLLVRPAAPQDTGNPQIAVDQQKIDYGYVKFGETRQFKIAVSNTGGGVLRFEKKPYVEVVEGCWPPDLSIGSMALKPGESTTVESTVFMMHSGMDGPHNFAVHLITNDKEHPDAIVTVLSDWGP